MAELHPPVGGIHEAALYVADLKRAERFWRRLGLPLVGRAPGGHASFRVGMDLLLLFGSRETVAGGAVPAGGSPGHGHVAFDVPDVGALARWRTFLEQAGVAIEAAQEWPGGGRSLYFRDPDGNSIELITRGTWGF
jgi:catechol 2,3-dioxygenase-like lactoylglutathione lyase family enzyme